MQRRSFCKTLPGIAVGLGGLALPKLLHSEDIGPESVQLGRIYQLQAAFHLAKSTQNIDLMMSLWDPNATLTIPGNSSSPFVGADQIKAFLLTTGSFTHLRFSMVPSFKIKIRIHGDQAFFYEECHDIASSTRRGCFGRCLGALRLPCQSRSITSRDR